MTCKEILDDIHDRCKDLSYEELLTQNVDLMHAVQTGIEHSMSIPGDKQCEPKNLRLGVNSALIDSEALAIILIAKGIITERAMREAKLLLWQAEVKAYERHLSDHLSAEVKLH
jgi:hypothetical protein